MCCRARRRLDVVANALRRRLREDGAAIGVCVVAVAAALRVVAVGLGATVDAVSALGVLPGVGGNSASPRSLLWLRVRRCVGDRWVDGAIGAAVCAVVVPVGAAELLPPAVGESASLWLPL